MLQLLAAHVAGDEDRASYPVDLRGKRSKPGSLMSRTRSRMGPGRTASLRMSIKVTVPQRLFTSALIRRRLRGTGASSYLDRAFGWRRDLAVS